MACQGTQDPVSRGGAGDALRYMTNDTSFERPMEIGDVMIGPDADRPVSP